jgi:hypothetical protein
MAAREKPRQTTANEAEIFIGRSPENIYTAAILVCSSKVGQLKKHLGDSTAERPPFGKQRPAGSIGRNYSRAIALAQRCRQKLPEKPIGFARAGVS